MLRHYCGEEDCYSLQFLCLEFKKITFSKNKTFAKTNQSLNKGEKNTI